MYNDVRPDFPRRRFRRSWIVAVALAVIGTALVAFSNVPTPPTAPVLTGVAASVDEIVPVEPEAPEVVAATATPQATPPPTSAPDRVPDVVPVAAPARARPNPTPTAAARAPVPRALTEPARSGLPPAGSARTPDAVGSSDDRAQVAIRFAMAQLGLPYVWGGNGPQNGDRGFDCSGLTYAAYAAAGIPMPRTAHTQYYAGPRLSASTPLAPGDLVFYGVPERVRHVGLYLGDGKMVNAPSFGKPVQVAAVRYRGDRYLGATRPSAEPGPTGPVWNLPTTPEDATQLPPEVFAAPPVDPPVEIPQEPDAEPLAPVEPEPTVEPTPDPLLPFLPTGSPSPSPSPAPPGPSPTPLPTAEPPAATPSASPLPSETPVPSESPAPSPEPTPAVETSLPSVLPSTSGP